MSGKGDLLYLYSTLPPPEDARDEETVASRSAKGTYEQAEPKVWHKVCDSSCPSMPLCLSSLVSSE